MQMNHMIKPCTDGDADYIRERDLDVYKSFVPIEKDAEERLVFKITDEFGCIIGGCVLDIDLSMNAELEHLWVDERYRRKGMASALIRRAEHTAREKGCQIMINSYIFDFQMARQLFEKLGYQIAGVTKNWPKGRESYTLIKRLGSVSKEDVPSKPSHQYEFEIRTGSEEDGEFITNRLEDYNSIFAPRTHPYLDLDKRISDGSSIIAGCIAGVSGWDTLHIDVIWVAEPYRGQGIGSYLLGEIEREAKEKGAYILLTQADDWNAYFFRKQGYTVRGELEDVPRGRRSYELQKLL